MSKKKLDSLQALRGFAALAVCFFHNQENLVFHNQGYGSILFGEGHIGVPIFFTISGFIMIYTSRNLSEDRFLNVKSFLFKRLIRIIPLYYFATLLFIVVCHHWYYFSERFFDLLKALLFLPGNTAPPLYVGWTLNFEMFFYIIFGFCLFFGRKKLYALLGIYAFLLILLPLLIKIPIGIDSQTASNNFSLATNILITITNKEQIFFLIGVLLGVLLPKLKLDYRLNYPLLILGVTLLSIVYLKIYNPYVLLGFPIYLMMGVIVLCFLLIDVSSKPLKTPRVFIFLGDISYSLYLIHPVTLVYLPGLAKKMGLAAYVKTPVFFCFWIAVTILCAAIMYRLIEIRFTRYLKAKLSIPPRNVIVQA